ncbi:MAG: ATPase, T2SS/T4P/T4SS family [Candidatus Woesearchaeota archaeon]
MGNVNFLEQKYDIQSKIKNSSSFVIGHVNEAVETIVAKVVNEFSHTITQIKTKKEKQNILEPKIINIIDNHNIIVKGVDRKELIKRVMDEIFGYGVLQKYIEDPAVNDIFINDENTIYVRKGQNDYKVQDSFPSRDKLNQYLLKVASLIGQKLNETHPIVDGADERYNLRINISIPPANTYNGCLTIRKRAKYFPLEYFRDNNFISKEMYEFFKLAQKIDLRIVFTGQMGSGKTTLLNSFIQGLDYRKVILEDTPEVYTNDDNTLYFRTIEGSKDGVTLTLSDLVKNFKRTSGTYPIIGEVRGKETKDIFDMFNSGFLRGCFSFHSNSGEDSINQFVYKLREAGMYGLSRSELEELIGKNIDIIVYMEKRKVVEIMEVDYNHDKCLATLNPLFEFVINNETNNEISGYFKKNNPYGKKIKDRLRRRGMKLPK